MFQAREHQNLALQFIKERESQGPLKGGILALKMGLGKTATVMKLVLDENDDDETLGLEKLSIGDKTYSNTATLVACSKTVLGEWINEKEKFFPNLRMLVYHRDFYKDFKNLSWEDLSEYDLVVTTYDVISTADRKKNFSSAICIKGEDGIHKDKIIGFRQIQSPSKRNERDPYGPHILFTYPWKRFVTDESQRFSNSKTKLFRAICSIYSKYRWCLTGTPIRNADSDMWSLLFFCGLTKPDNPKNYKYEHFYDVKNIMLVMGYQEAKIELPKLISHDIKIDFNAEEYEIYKFYLQELWDAYDRFIRQTGEFAGEDGFALILGLFCRLRQICISTYLVTDESKRDSSHSLS